MLVLFVSVLNHSDAQKLVFFFGHAGYASSVGKLREANNVGLGLEGGVGVGLGKIFIVGTTGTTWLRSNKQPGVKYTPFTAGVRKYLLLKNLFVKGDIGLATMKVIDTDTRSSHLTTSFGAGLKLTGFEVLADYNSVASYGSWVGLKIGIALGI